MNRRAWMAGAAAVLMGLATFAARGQDRRTQIAFISMDRAFSEYYKTKLADTQLKTQAEEFNQERQKMVADIQTMQETFNTLREESQNNALSEEVRALKRNEAEEKLLEIKEQEGKIRRFDELRAKQLEDQSRRMRRGLVEEIREAIRTYARAQGFDAVLDHSGQSLNGVNVVLYADTRVDITDAIVRQLNQTAE